jgi:hypothetical protein
MKMDSRLLRCAIDGKNKKPNWLVSVKVGDALLRIQDLLGACNG